MALGLLYLEALRLTHVLLGAFWVGAGLFFTLFLGPAVRAAGPDGGKVMAKLQLSTGWSKMIGSAAGLTVLSGILLYVRNGLAADTRLLDELEYDRRLIALPLAA